MSWPHPFCVYGLPGPRQAAKIADLRALHAVRIYGTSCLLSFFKSIGMFTISSFQRLLSELKRRHVFRVACGYAAAGFVVVEVANAFFPPLKLPEWSTTLVVALVILGFPVAVGLAWAFDITPQGVQRADGEAAAPVARVPAHRVPLYIGLGMVLALVSFGGYSAYRALPLGEGKASALAVLPFGNLSADPENEYFSDGMTEDVLGQLANIRQIRLIPRTSVMQYKRTKKTAREIGQELSVTHVLEGSVRRYGSSVRVAAKLIDARTDELLWSDEYDRDLSDILAVQSEIAREIARKLNARLSLGDRERFAAGKSRTIDPQAYEAYLRGIYHGDEGRQAEAIRAFEMAVEIQPDFASAHVGIARNAFFLGLYGLVPPRGAFAKMHQAAQRALDLDDSMADAHAALALYKAHYERNWAEAEAGFERALELNANNAQVHHDYAHLLLALGRRADSARESQKAAELDPTNSMLTACAGWHGFTNGEYEEAVIRSLKALMMMPDMFWPEMVLGWAYEQTGQSQQAIAAFRKASAHSNGSSFSMASLAHALAKAQRPSEAADVLRDLQTRAQTAYVSPYDIAIVHASLNEVDHALANLEKAREERSGFLVHAGWDPRLVPLHQDVRFDALLRSLGLPKQPIAMPRASKSKMAGSRAM